MTDSTFSLSWESHRNNICHGLSILQQNGEFVDMTLAADGHHVKVHQMILALSSPYIKELITSAACPHPVILLNKISYTTLSAILEYIYTGEVLVSVEHLSDLVEAARELHIKGLEDMDFQQSMFRQRAEHKSATTEEDCNAANMDDDICYFEVTESSGNTPCQNTSYTMLDDGVAEDSQSIVTSGMEEETVQDQENTDNQEKKPRIVGCIQNSSANESNLQTSLQYTVSNQGSLQMILNRYVYYMKHCNRNKSRQWRCVDYLNPRKCPAIVFTLDEVVVQRIGAHTHGFHDKRILKKVQGGGVFTILQEAENQGKEIKNKTKDVNE